MKIKVGKKYWMKPRLFDMGPNVNEVICIIGKFGNRRYLIKFSDNKYITNTDVSKRWADKSEFIQEYRE
jgi:hypothetical protein